MISHYITLHCVPQRGAGPRATTTTTRGGIGRLSNATARRRRALARVVSLVRQARRERRRRRRRRERERERERSLDGSGCHSILYIFVLTVPCFAGSHQRQHERARERERAGRCVRRREEPRRRRRIRERERGELVLRETAAAIPFHICILHSHIRAFAEK